MKIKGDHVTNSSSVSYIIGIENIKDVNAVFGYERKLLMLKTHSRAISDVEDDRSYDLTTEQQLLNFMEEEFGIHPLAIMTASEQMDWNCCYNEFYNTALNLIKEGGKVYYVTYDYGEETKIARMDQISTLKQGDGVFQIYCDH